MGEPRPQGRNFVSSTLQPYTVQHSEHHYKACMEVDPEVAFGPQPSSLPYGEPPHTHNSSECGAHSGFAREEFLSEGAYDSDASTTTKQWWDNSDGVGLPPFSMRLLAFIISLARMNLPFHFRGRRGRVGA